MRRALSGHLPLILAALVAGLLLIPFLVSAQGSGAPPTGTWESVNNVIKLVVWTITAQFFGFLVWTGGALLDYTVRTFIVEFGIGFQSWGLGFAVNNLWTVVRDLFNLTFIFALVYIGFRMILDSDDSGAKKAIVNLVIAALLVNFSLFFTKAIIDFTNITATQVANVIYNGQNPGTAGSISATFMESMGLSTVLGSNITSGSAAAASWSYIIGTIILCLIAAFAFVAGAILLGIRFITLNYFMVISPIMFIGRVFPFLQSWQSGFWNSFLKNAFFAPAFLLMLYFSIYILQNLGGLIRRDNPGLEATFNASVTSPNVNAIAVFLIAGGFLIGSVLIAQKMSVVGGGVAVKLGNNLRGRAQGLVGRGAVNGFGIKALSLNQLDKNLEKRGFTERSMLRALPMAARNAKFGSSYSAKGVDDDTSKGKATAARFTATEKIRTAVNNYKKDQSEANKIKMEQAIAGASSDQINEVLGGLSGEDRKMVVAQLSNSQFENVMKAKDEVFSDSDKSEMGGERQTATQNALRERARSSAGADAAAAAYQNARINNNLSHEAATQVAEIERQRKISELSDDKVAYEAGFKKASIEELRTLGEDELMKNAGLLTIGQIDKIKDDKELTPTQKERITTKWKQLLIEKFVGSDAGARAVFTKIKAEDAAKLPTEILVSERAVPFLTPDMLNKMKEKLDNTSRGNLRSLITNPSAPAFAAKPETLASINDPNGRNRDL